jgi:uncharacterized membrane protein YwaF
MIQRIQSIFLGLVTLLHILLFFIPVFVWEGYSMPDQAGADMKAMTALYNIPFIALNALIILFSIFIILQFKDRKKQRSYVRILTVIIILNICLYLYYMFTITLQGEYVLLPAKSIGIYLQLISIVLCLLAARRIKKDEDLVKSVDRIR